MSGTVPLLRLYGFMACAGTALPSLLSGCWMFDVESRTSTTVWPVVYAIRTLYELERTPSVGRGRISDYEYTGVRYSVGKWQLSLSGHLSGTCLERLTKTTNVPFGTPWLGWLLFTRDQKLVAPGSVALIRTCAVPFLFQFKRGLLFEELCPAVCCSRNSPDNKTHEMKYRQNVALVKSLFFLPVQRNPVPNLMSLKCMTQRSVLFQFVSFIFYSPFSSCSSSFSFPSSSPSRRYGNYLHSMDALYRPSIVKGGILKALKIRCLLRSVFVHRLQRN
jgi:hypothetical protein